MAYDLDAIRRKMKQMDGRKSDPDEFRPAKAKPGEVLKYRFFVLPGVLEGDKLKSGVASKSMDVFYVNYGQHWIKNQPNACPRVYDGSDCQLCEVGLNFLRDKTLSEADRQQLRQDWLPNSSYVVNIFFPNWKNNPEELRGKVMYYKAPKTVFDKWVNCINKDAPDVDDVDGDDDEPEAYGAFFDENSAWLFELQIAQSGKSNGYKTSRFIVGSDKKPVPLARDESGAPNKKAIAALLASRIDIWGRLEAPDSMKIKNLANHLMNGDDEPATSKVHVEEEEDDAIVEAPKAKARQQEKPPEKAPEKPKPKPVVEEDDDDDIDSSDLDSLLGQLNDD